MQVILLQPGPKTQLHRLGMHNLWDWYLERLKITFTHMAPKTGSSWFKD